jgi:hypothetical protein
VKRTSIFSRREDGEFNAPSFADDVSLEQYLAACPSSAETLGTFFTHVRDLVEQATGSVPDALFDSLPATGATRCRASIVSSTRTITECSRAPSSRSRASPTFASGDSIG